MTRIQNHQIGIVHMPKGWRDCLDSPYCSTLDQATSELIRKETAYFKSL